MNAHLLHATHPDIRMRLKRAEGHLRRVISMLEGNHACLEIAQQLHAVEKSIAAAKKVLIKDHLQNCLDQVAQPLDLAQRRALREFQDMTKYL